MLNWGELARSHGLLLRDWLGIGQRVVSGCVVHHLFFLSFILLCPFSFHYNCYCSLFCFFFFFNYWTVLISTMGLPFSDSLPHPTKGEWANGCVIFSCCLRLNHSSPLQEEIVQRTMWCGYCSSDLMWLLLVLLANWSWCWKEKWALNSAYTDEALNEEKCRVFDFWWFLTVEYLR